MTQATILALQSVGFKREEIMTLSLSLSLEVEDNSSQKSFKNSNLSPKKVFIGLPIGLSDLNPLRLGSLKLTQKGS